jgi:hypothetical protein
MPRPGLSMAYEENSSASKGARSATSNNFILGLFEPLKWRPLDLTLLVRVGTRSSRGSTRNRGLSTALTFMDGEAIVKLDIVDDRVKSSHFKTPELSTKLFKEVRVMAMNRAQEEHHHQDLRDSHFAPR